MRRILVAMASSRPSNWTADTWHSSWLDQHSLISCYVDRFPENWTAIWIKLRRRPD